MPGCRKCGAGGSKTVIPSMAGATGTNTELIQIEYIGKQGQKRRLTSKVDPSAKYVFSGDSRKFLAYRGDVDWLTRMTTEFRVAEEPEISTEAQYIEAPVLTSLAKPVNTTDLPLDVLALDPITLGLLKREFSTVSQLRQVGRSAWLMIKGIGASRADDIAEALDALR